MRRARASAPGQCLVFVAVLLSSFSAAFGGSSKAHRPHQSSSSTGSTAAPQAAGPSSSTTNKKKSKKRRSKREPTQKAPTPQRISEIQSALARGGYFEGAPSGKWDATTVAAMQKFQSGNGLEPTGKLNALSLQKLGLGSEIAGVSAPKPVNHSSAPAPPSAAPKPSVPTAPLSPPSAGSASASTATPAAKPPQP